VIERISSIGSSLYTPGEQKKDHFAKSINQMKHTNVASMVGRFFLVKHTKTGKIYQISAKYNKWS
jgi:hypothetical protein